MPHVIVPDEPTRVQFTVTTPASTGPFAFAFSYFSANDVEVYNGTSLVDPNDYTLTPTASVTGGYEGGSITLDVAVLNTTITVLRNVPIERETDFPTSGPFPINTLNSWIDRVYAILQQIGTKVGRTMRVADTDASFTGTIPVKADRLGKLLRFNSTTGEPEVVASADIGTTTFATAAEMTAGTATSVIVAPKELTEWSPAAATLASADELLVRDATDSKIKRMAVLAGISYAMIQNVSATSRVLGRKTAGAGVTEELTLSELLDFIGSAAQGDILYRGASAWARLAAGTSGQFLKTQVAGSSPAWDSVSAAIVQRVYAEYTTHANFSTTIPFDDTKPQNTEGTEIVTASITPTSATNRIRIRYSGNWGTSGTNHYLIAALFQSGSADALRAVWAYDGNGYGALAGGSDTFSAEVEFVAGTTSAITISARIGSSTGAAIYINGTSSARRFGGSAAHTLVVEELKV